MTSPVTSGPWTRTIALRWKPIQILASGVGCTTTIPNYPRGDATADATAETGRAATIKSLLLLRLVSSFNSNHRPEDLQEPEADEEERAAGQGELRKRTGLALRPARGKASLSTPSTRRRVRLLGGVEGASSTPPRRGLPVDCRTDRDWSPSLPKKVDLSSLMGPLGGPRLGTPSCAAATAQSAHSRVARTCAARIGAERLCASSSDRVEFPEQPCVDLCGRQSPGSGSALFSCKWPPHKQPA